MAEGRGIYLWPYHRVERAHPKYVVKLIKKNKNDLHISRIVWHRLQTHTANTEIDYMHTPHTGCPHTTLPRYRQLPVERRSGPTIIQEIFIRISDEQKPNVKDERKRNSGKSRISNFKWIQSSKK